MLKLKAKELLQEKKLSVTRPRKEILGLLINSHGPFSVEEILELLPPGTCDQATVYRVLAQLRENDLAKEVHLGEDFSRFEFNTPGSHHHHIICKSCQKIDHIEDCFIDPFLNKIKKMGYTDVDHKLEFNALCSECQKA